MRCARQNYPVAQVEAVRLASESLEAYAVGELNSLRRNVVDKVVVTVIDVEIAVTKSEIDAPRDLATDGGGGLYGDVRA